MDRRFQRSARPSGNRQRCRPANGAKRKAGLHLRDTRQPGEVLAVNAREILRILGDDLEQVIRRPRHEMTFQHIGDARDRLLERLQDFVRLPLQCDLNEYGRRDAQFAGVQKGDVIADDALFFQPLDPPVAGGRRQIDEFRQPAIG